MPYARKNKALATIVLLIISLSIVASNFGNNAPPLTVAQNGSSNTEDIKSKVTIEADYILKCQFIKAGDPASGAINYIYGEPTEVVPSLMTSAMQALIIASNITGNQTYRERAELAADYLTRIQQPDGAWCNQYYYTANRDANNAISNYTSSKFPPHTAGAVIALCNLGNLSRYEAVKNGVKFLLDCQNPQNKGGNVSDDDGLICAGKDSESNYNKWRWCNDNSYAYLAFTAAANWAFLKNDSLFGQTCLVAAAKIINGINKYLYIGNQSDPDYGTWYKAIDENHILQGKGQRELVNYYPQLLDLPVTGVNSSIVGENLHKWLQKDDGSVIVNTVDKSNWKSPSFSFQSMLIWEDLGQKSYNNSALTWAEASGLWQLNPDEHNISGGWIDWISDITRAPTTQRTVDTSFYFIAAITGGYDFSSISTPTTPPLADYVVVASSGSGGTINPNGNMSATQGTSYTFTITPNSGYQILDVVDNGLSKGAVSSYTVTNIRENHQIVASFSHLTDYVVVASSGSGGTINPNGNMSATQGTSYTFTITPNSGYQILDVVDNGLSKGAVSSYTVTNIRENHQIVASFSHLTDYVVVASSGSGGTINPNGNMSATQGTSYTFTITPNSGYQILDVVDNGLSKGAVSSYTVTNIRENHQIVASFSHLTDYVVVASSGSGGTINPNGNMSATQGTSYTFTITPNSGYQILDVVDNGLSKGAVSSYTVTNIRENHQIVASFYPTSTSNPVSIDNIIALLAIFVPAIVSIIGILKRDTIRRKIKALKDLYSF